MKAPDKIYIAQLWEKPSIEQTGFSPIWSDEVRPAFNNIPYIRKEAILEWAKRLKEALALEEPSSSSYRKGVIKGLDLLINHIELL